MKPKGVLPVRRDGKGTNLQTRRQAIVVAQAAVRKLTGGRKGLVAEFLRERWEEEEREEDFDLTAIARGFVGLTADSLRE